MKKNIVKPKFYILDNDTVKKDTTAYIFFKHFPAKLKENNPETKTKPLTYAITRLYYKTENDKFNNRYINIAEVSEVMDPTAFKQYLIMNYNISGNTYTLKPLIKKNNIVVYLIFLMPETKIPLYYENIFEIVNKERLSVTDNYWGLLSTGFSKARKAYLNRCLYTTDKSIKLEMRFKKVYKALIEI